jgi:hypothetical protein
MLEDIAIGDSSMRLCSEPLQLNLTRVLFCSVNSSHCPSEYYKLHLLVGE